MITSLPNLLTLSRIFVIPLIVGLYFMVGDPVQGDTIRWIIFGLYVVAGATDYFDGVAARSMNLTSKLGRFLDPIADKLLVAAIILMMVAERDLAGIDVLPGLVILIREITVSGLREFLAELRVGMPVSKLAKWKTTIQLLALGFLIVGPASPSVIPSILIGHYLIWAAAALTIITGFDYLRAGLKHMTSGE